MLTIEIDYLKKCMYEDFSYLFGEVKNHILFVDINMLVVGCSTNSIHQINILINYIYDFLKLTVEGKQVLSLRLLKGVREGGISLKQ